MGNFGDGYYVKTRKDHTCVCCKRKIEKGLYAYYYKGRYEDCWQNWYACEFCETNCSDDWHTEGIDYDDFTWFIRYNSRYMRVCPKCGEYVEYFEDCKGDKLHFECDICEKEFDVTIYGSENNSVDFFINNCKLAKQLGSPTRAKNGLCEGFTTNSYNDEPCEECKNCKNYYLTNDGMEKEK